MLGKIANNCNFIKTEKLKIGADTQMSVPLLSWIHIRIRTEKNSRIRIRKNECGFTALEETFL